MHKLARLTPLGRRHMVQRLAAGARVRDLAAAIDLSTTPVRRWWRRFQRVGHRIHGDHTRRTPRAGYDYLHIAIDDRTRLAYAALLPDQTAASAAAFLTGVQRWFAARGVRIQALLTDNGSAYVGHVFGALRRQLGIRHHRTRPYSPHTT